MVSKEGYGRRHSTKRLLSLWACQRGCVGLWHCFMHSSRGNTVQQQRRRHHAVWATRSCCQLCGRQDWCMRMQVGLFACLTVLVVANSRKGCSTSAACHGFQKIKFLPESNLRPVLSFAHSSAEKSASRCGGGCLRVEASSAHVSDPGTPPPHSPLPPRGCGVTSDVGRMAGLYMP